MASEFTCARRSSRLAPRHLVVVVVAALTALSCITFPNPKSDDEGDPSFAREAFPVLLGRRAYGVNEVEVVADIAQLYGRPTAIRMLMQDTAFVDHWSDTLVDIVRMKRDILGGVGAAQDANCWGDPTLPTPDPTLAEWVRDNGPTAAGGPTGWNMTDLLRSAIVLDDLSPVYRANLFAMSTRRRSTAELRPELTDHFLRTYLNRDIACLRCHNPTYSTSNKKNEDGDIVWRRLWAISGHPEKALFGDYYDATAVLSRLRPIFRGDVRKPVAEGSGIRPWGMSGDCAKNTDVTAPQNDGDVLHQDFRILPATTSNYETARFGSLDGATNPKLAVWELEAALRQGIEDLEDGYERFPASDPLLPPNEQQYCDVVQLFASNCVGCHSQPAPPAGMDLTGDLSVVLVDADTQGGNSTLSKRVVAGSASDSELYRRVSATTSPPRMPPGGGGLGTEGVALIEQWINDGASVFDPDDCNTSHVPDVAPDEAFAYLTASNLVDGIWASVMGHRLTIDHGFPRNAKQRNALQSLTESTFLPNHWSLKAVLEKILSSNWFARRAPAISQATSAYELPMVLGPFEQADPTVVPNPLPHEQANGQGHLVNRWRVNTTLRTIASTLNWKQPRRFTDGGYPSPLDAELGQYFGDTQPGFADVNFQSLLALEASVGLCVKSGKALDSDDWIDRLVSETATFNAANPDAPLTVAEVWSMLKDRMIQDPTIERTLPSGLTGVTDAKTEEEALTAFFNQGAASAVDLNTSATSLPPAELTSKLRQGCGLLVKTPEFLLGGATPRGYSDNNMPDPPRMSVCMEGEACGYPQACSKWRGVLQGMGHNTACEDRSVRKATLLVGTFDFDLHEVLERERRLCPGRYCRFLQVDVRACLLDPEGCEPIPPLPPEDDESGSADAERLPTSATQPGVLSLRAEGATVQEARQVLHWPVGGEGWRPLKVRTELEAGDTLYVPLNADLAIVAKDFKLDVAGMRKETVAGVRAHLISITGPSALAALDRHFTKKGALRFSQLAAAAKDGSFESKGFGDEQFKKAIGYGAKPESKRVPTPEEIAELNKDADALHFPKETGMAPDGTEFEPPPAQPEPEPEAKMPRWLIAVLGLLLLILVLLAMAWLIRRMR